MASPISSYGSFVLSLKVALMSTAVLSVAVVLKLSVPLVTDFAVSELPVMYASFLAWLRPPYLYLVINGIIISIVASSKLLLQTPEESKKPEIIPQPLPRVAPMKVSGVVLSSGLEYQDLNVTGMVMDDKEVTVVNGRDEVVSLSKSAQPLERSDSVELLAERQKPLVSARFGLKKSVKSSPEVLGVSKPKRQDTLESAWKMITDGRPMPLTRHLKKSDTWDSHVSSTPPSTTMKKSDTFSENNSKSKLSQNRQGSGKLKKEPSLSQDELNRRVEAFIKKFNEEMRLQRQESLNQFQEMISRGAY
ncbi:uncharacterized protein LOC105632812 isoform X2 [Jatropha curcas]|uniref:uncharacterized protein LOC105632812 isoform X2 n=1 Tax=Jatropha curcas TaxID=180498 RepID=UPI0005FB4C16|nr:uncharacterized protein LOC105632812 isoform X2 [Jatropha curcas]